tara:strand:+ start:110 stop:1951 length:1842 start_codon:yes stop_codon:yes gene_type:complete
MAKYSDIKGFTVQTLASDTVASQFVGGAWSSASSMNNARLDMGSSQAATQSSGILAGGSPTPGYDKAESWNGSSWTEVAELNQPRGESPGGAGVYTSAIVFGGFTTTNVTNSESWNGSAWTATPALNNGRRALSGGFGTANTAAIAVGGYASSTVRNNVESWDGSSWTEVNEMNTGRNSGASVGTTTAGILYGGSAAPGVFNNVETWDGTNFTETTEINTARDGLAGAGTQTSALGSGGYATARVAITEHWNGSSWTELADLSLARDCNNNGFGTADAALVGGGSSAAAPSGTGATELFDAPSLFNQQIRGQLFYNSTANAFKETISDVPGTSWSSGTNLNQARSFNNASGDLTSAITFGGSPAPTQAYSEQWDGSSWTEVGDLNEGRVAGAAGGASGTDAIIAGGYELPNIGNSLKTETWNGSSWTEVNALNAQKYTAGSGIPVSTSGIAFGGNPVVATAEVWDGTNWTEVGDLNNARMYLGGFGNATSAIAANGVEPPHTQNKVEKWDGTSWTEVAEMNTARGEFLQGQGRTNESGIMAGGSPNGSSQITNTEIWNGSSWSETNDLATARRMGGQIGPTSSGMYVGGQTPGNVVTVEHWDSPLANKTITAS